MALQAQFPSSCGSLDWVDISCGGGGGIGGGFHNYYFNLQQQKQQQLPVVQQQQQQQQCNMQQQLQNQQQLSFEKSSLLFHPSAMKAYNTTAIHLPSMLPTTQSMAAAYEERERQEFDRFLRLQNGSLSLILQQQRKQQLAMLLKITETKSLPLLRQKDEEISHASKKTRELEDFLKKLEMENQEWQRVAQENEAMVISLSNSIEQLREKASGCSSNGAEDAESCCDVYRQGEGEGTEYRNRGFLFGGDAIIDDAAEGENISSDDEKGTWRMICKGCKSRNSCVLFLPCRHLSSCKACDEFLDTCPVCQTVKKASIEALMG